ncbi:cytochrome c biogenesis protein ResB [Elusimicrobiota bacterium]
MRKTSDFHFPKVLKKPFFKFLASVKLLFWLIPMIMLLSLIGTLIPQGESQAWYYQRYGNSLADVFMSAGLTDVYHAFYFVGLLFVLALNLALCSLKKISDHGWRPGFFVTHTGILIILIGGMISGIWGKHGILPLYEGESGNQVKVSGGNFALPFHLRLKNFTVEYYESAKHRLMISSLEDKWSEVFDIEPEGMFELKSRGLKLKILGYYPNFIMGDDGPANRSQTPENPAIQVNISGNGVDEDHWAFDRFPEFHKDPKDRYKVSYRFMSGRIKQFKSHLEVIENDSVAHAKTIYVNEPLKWRGYTVYQSGYDPKDLRFSSLLVSKDPGAWVVYAGFIILPVGLLWTFYGKKKKVRNA